MAGFDPTTGEFIPDFTPEEAGHVDFLQASPGPSSTPSSEVQTAPPAEDTPVDFHTFMSKMQTGAVTHPTADGAGSTGGITDPSQMRSQSGGVNVGSTQSFGGVTEHGRAQAGAIFNPRMAEADAMNQQEQQQFNQNQAGYGQAYDALHSANAQVAKASQEHYANEMAINRQFSDFLTLARQAEEVATAEAGRRSDQYIAAYTSEMSYLRTEMMKTGNPLGGLSFIEGGAMGAATFAQGYLGARYGIKIDPVAQINQWVTQEMAGHQNKIQNLNSAAQGQLRLYDIARQQGLDDQQTRMRLRGFVIDGFKQSMLMEASRYQSSTAMADAQAKAAQLDMAQLANTQAMWKETNTRMQENIRLMTDLAYKEAATAREQMLARSQVGLNAAHAQKLNAETAKTKKETEQLDGAGEVPMFVDMSLPEKDDKGNIIGYPERWAFKSRGDFLKSSQNDMLKSFQETSVIVAGMNDSLALLDKIRKRYGDKPFDQSVWNGLSTQEQKMVSAVSENIIAGYRRKNFGSALTKAEIDNLDKRGVQEPWFAVNTLRGRENLIAREIRTAQQAEAAMAGLVEVPGKGRVVKHTSPMTGYEAAWETKTAPDASNTAVSSLVGSLQTSKADDLAGVAGKAPRMDLFKEYQERKGPDTSEGFDKYPTYLQGHQDVEILAGIAKRGKELDQPAKVKEAVDALKGIADGTIKVKGLTGMEAFAQYALSRLDEETGGGQRSLPGIGTPGLPNAGSFAADDPNSIVNTQVPADVPFDVDAEIARRNRDRGY